MQTNSEVDEIVREKIAKIEKEGGRGGGEGGEKKVVKARQIKGGREEISKKKERDWQDMGRVRSTWKQEKPKEVSFRKKRADYIKCWERLRN